MDVKYETNVFCRLFRYRNRPSRTSEEDFLTEAYATVLLSDKEAATRVLRALFEVSLSSDFRLETQQTHGGNRPDMQFSDARYLIFQENKVSAEFDDQIKRYQETIAEVDRHKEKLVVSCAITSDLPDHHDSPKHIHRRWCKVYEAIRDECPTVDQSSRRLWNDFLYFLESKGMQPIRIEQRMVDAFQDVAKLWCQLWQLQDQVEDHLESAYEVRRVPTMRKSTDKWYILKDSFDSGGLKIATGFDLKKDDGSVIIMIRISGDTARRETAAQLQPLFRDAGWDNWDAVTTFQSIRSDFFDVVGEEQCIAVNRWIDEVLKPLVEGGLVQRKGT